MGLSSCKTRSSPTTMPKKQERKKRAPGPRDISILTPLQESRFHMTNLCVATIARQTWVHRIQEWVVIDGTPEQASDQWQACLEEIHRLVATYPQLKHLRVVDAGTTAPPAHRVIGCFRNCINAAMTGEWGVWMDDDDVYPNTRVEVAVRLMERENKLVAGCSPHCIFDPDMGDVTFQFRVFHPNHATNNTLAYRRAVLEQTRYDDEARNAEEPEFLQKFKLPMAQIPAEHAVLQVAHGKNTYNKRELLMVALTARYLEPSMEGRASCRVVGGKPWNFVRVAPRVVQEYSAALFSDLGAESPYDIVYYLGIHSNRASWSPYQDDLGGSEQAVVHLAEEWASRGYRVAVYGHLYCNDRDAPLRQPGDAFLHNSVTYCGATTFRCSHHYRNLIIWRALGAVPLLHLKLRVRNLVLDLHDRHDCATFEASFGDGKNVFDVVCTKSTFHRNQVLETLRQGNATHLLRTWERAMFVQPNGVRRDVFYDPERSLARRDLYRLVYCSSYDRGLQELLLWFFPTLRKLDERFTLDVMYGMDGVDPVRQQVFKQLLNQPGVTDHGRVSRERVRDFKYEAGFHLYYTWTTAEIDCISVRESALCGCIPVLSMVGIFPERPGLHFHGDPRYADDHARAAHALHRFIQQSGPEKMDEVRKMCVGSKLGADWSEAADAWARGALDLPPTDQVTEPQFEFDKDVQAPAPDPGQQIVLSV